MPGEFQVEVGSGGFGTSWDSGDLGSLPRPVDDLPCGIRQAASSSLFTRRCLLRLQFLQGKAYLSLYVCAAPPTVGA